MKHEMKQMSSTAMHETALAAKSSEREVVRNDGKQAQQVSPISDASVQRRKMKQASYFRNDRDIF